MRKYCWPFALFIGVPFIASIVSLLSPSLLAGDYERVYLYAGVSGGVTAALLAVLYLPVRSAQNATLRLIWACWIVVSGVSSLTFFGALIGGLSASFAEAAAVFAVAALIALAPLLWFARAASRLSFAHAVFLAFIVGGLAPPDLDSSLPVYAAWLPGLAAGIVAIWLLANFDERSARFRKSAAIAVVAWQGLAPFALSALLLSSLVGAAVTGALLALKLLLVYLVRVRGASPPPDSA